MSEPRTGPEPASPVDRVGIVERDPRGVAGIRRILDQEIVLEIGGAGTQLTKPKRQAERGAQDDLLSVAGKTIAGEPRADFALGKNAEVLDWVKARVPAHDRRIEIEPKIPCR